MPYQEKCHPWIFEENVIGGSLETYQGMNRNIDFHPISVERIVVTIEIIETDRGRECIPFDECSKSRLLHTRMSIGWCLYYSHFDRIQKWTSNNRVRMVTKENYFASVLLHKNSRRRQWRTGWRYLDSSTVQNVKMLVWMNEQWKNIQRSINGQKTEE